MLGTVRTILLAFHGFTLNGTPMRTQMGQLADALGAHVETPSFRLPRVAFLVENSFVRA